MTRNAHVHPTIRPILDNVCAAFSAVARRRDEHAQRLDAIDLGDARKFLVTESDVREAVDRLVVCRKCNHIGDVGNARDVGVNQQDGLREYECIFCRREETKA